MGIVIALVLILLLISGAIFFNCRNKKFPDEYEPFISKIDLIFFNDSGLRCSNGAVLNGEISVHGVVLPDHSREMLKKSLIKILHKMASQKHPDWFFISRDEFLSEFKELISENSLFSTIHKIEVISLEDSDGVFFNKELQQKEEEDRKEMIRQEVERRTAELEKEREEMEAKLEAERQMAMYKAEAEMELARAKAEAEMKAAMEENERLLQEAIQREEEAKRKLNE